mmetsp:Transcript_12813/g.25030  ORF Transcript_12813/g.25030 Transcript_12813/m.25030 type:complete len:152 (+) Transcript_12813:657-1112(+)
MNNDGSPYYVCGLTLQHQTELRVMSQPHSAHARRGETTSLSPHHKQITRHAFLHNGAPKREEKTREANMYSHIRQNQAVTYLNPLLRDFRSAHNATYTHSNGFLPSILPYTTPCNDTGRKEGRKAGRKDGWKARWKEGSVDASEQRPCTYA